MLMPINTTLARKGTRQPHDKKLSSDIVAPIARNARFASITPAGAPAWAKAP